MSDLRLIAPPPRGELVAGLRSRLGQLVPGGQVIAEGVLGADARIDYVVVDPVGGLAVVLVLEHDEDLEAVGLALAQRAWLLDRRADWLQLAPKLGLRADSPVRAVLLCPDFCPTSLAAVRSLGRDVLSACRYRCVQGAAGIELLVEHVDFDRREPPEVTRPPAPSPAAAPEPPAPAEPSEPAASEFRTGLTDADLGLTPEERLEFE